MDDTQVLAEDVGRNVKQEGNRRAGNGIISEQGCRLAGCQFAARTEIEVSDERSIDSLFRTATAKFRKSVWPCRVLLFDGFINETLCNNVSSRTRSGMPFASSTGGPELPNRSNSGQSISNQSPKEDQQ